ncbi:MAG: nucleotidyltransferase [Chloroflexi bacterium GWB2_49_20]|nr:MAG: nucleotidyltransferase [Chloroflexi bacterium GWB2_49_20]OGN76919.1 MAG: nucleotidyltransferase [Chloroflexi bacterium GWC2_49_37]OGN84885.1 MAG: nucleotidyltransferase [Chloroflexi bacterium GWD2_49_16]HCM96590.1 nucleotidyltransferase [Anaerolineae bacterium]
MSRDISLYFDDIAICCEKVLRFADGLTFEQFKKNELIYDAVLRNLEIIGEASKHVPEDIQEKFPQIEWRKIAGFRDIVAHEYFGVTDEIVWDIVENKIAKLLEQVQLIRNSKFF